MKNRPLRFVVLGTVLVTGACAPTPLVNRNDGAVIDTFVADARADPVDVPSGGMDVPNRDVPNADAPNADVPNGRVDAAMDVASNDVVPPRDVPNGVDVPNAVDVLNRDASTDVPVIVAPAYSVNTMLMADCDDLSRGEVQVDVVGDDEATAAPIMLPFAFRLYGAPVSHWSATTNGYAQLYADGRGTPSTSYTNTSLPDRAAPPGMLAAFWDDLLVEDPALVRTQTLGMGPERRFVVEWIDVARIVGATTLRFQIKLYESSNVIEYHYCTLNGDSSDGAEATIGLQSLDPAVGDLVGFDAPGTLTEGQRIRFTPR